MSITQGQLKVLMYLLDKPSEKLVPAFTPLDTMAEALGIPRTSLHHHIDMLRAKFGDNIIETTRKGAGGYRLPENVRAYLKGIVNGI